MVAQDGIPQTSRPVTAARRPPPPLPPKGRSSHTLRVVDEECLLSAATRPRPRGWEEIRNAVAGRRDMRRAECVPIRHSSLGGDDNGPVSQSDDGRTVRMARGAVAGWFVAAVFVGVIGACGGDEHALTAVDYARRSCAAVVGLADIPERETMAQDHARQRRETADATRAADLDPRWRRLADAQKGRFRIVVDGEDMSDDERAAVTGALLTECESFRRRP